jgi:O-antigen ligase
MKKVSSTTLIRRFVIFSPFLFPAYFFRFTLAGIPLTVLELFIYLLFGLWLLTLNCPKSFYFRKPLSWYFLCGALLFIGVSLGVLTAPAFIPLPDDSILHAQNVALGVWKGWVVAPLLYFIVLSQSLTDRSQVERFLRFFVYSAALVSLLAYVFGLFGNGFTYDQRLSGFYESANYLSLYLVPAVLLNIVWLFQRRGKRTRQDTLDTATLVILLHALFLTQSYAAILAVFGSIGLYILYFILQKGRNARRALVGLLILFATFFVIIGTQFHTTKFKQFLDVDNRSSTTVRFEIYQVSWNLIEDNWFFGHGPGLYQATYQTHAPDILGRAPMEWNIPHPHNVFFAFWLNAGLLGLLALLWIHVLAHRRFTYPLLAFWGIILHGFFDTPFWKNDLAMVFWAIVAAIMLLQSFDKKRG